MRSLPPRIERPTFCWVLMGCDDELVTGAGKNRDRLLPGVGSPTRLRSLVRMGIGEGAQSDFVPEQGRRRRRHLGMAREGPPQRDLLRRRRGGEALFPGTARLRTDGDASLSRVREEPPEGMRGAEEAISSPSTEGDGKEGQDRTELSL